MLCRLEKHITIFQETSIMFYYTRQVSLVLLKYDLRDQLLTAIKSLYKQSEVYVRAKGMKAKLFSVRVGLQEGCILSPLLFIICMDKINRNISFSSGVTLGYLTCLALLSSNENNFQHALDRFLTHAWMLG